MASWTLDRPAAATMAHSTFSSTETLGGSVNHGLGSSTNNTIVVRPSSSSTAFTLTLGSGITITGGSGTIYGYFSNDSIVNNGTIQTNGGTINIGGGNPLTNAGFIIASNGGSIQIDIGNPSNSIAGTWTNQGTFIPTARAVFASAARPPVSERSTRPADSFIFSGFSITPETRSP